MSSDKHVSRAWPVEMRTYSGRYHGMYVERSFDRLACYGQPLVEHEPARFLNGFTSGVAVNLRPAFSCI